MRDQLEQNVASSLQYAVDSLDDFRSSVYQCGIQAMDRAQERSLTPIYFSSVASMPAFDVRGTQTSSQNYYKIKDAFSKI
ncbi:MAG: hypothetical protein JSS86_04145 [Cyanobacteria bacterium SZAS LIN-2]|nr:hypothetical protein [Cyanobacteria bacterium SZAS LIN-3]MBS1995472.1 hypothetical protein [Cyanobacteria bacterium SZAS LIN-2]MBS2006033.1 hypothetical protein [Cyanobacteria bacterium SZAS TMP-1]